tara:strand:- start:604 stop:1290 length:687 start_codon:yes stop_codon:yes gene_type:complete
MADKIRVQKYMAQQGLCSRRQAEKWIEQGWVTLNGNIIDQQGIKMDPDQDHIEINDQAKQQQAACITIKYYKPRGIVTHSPSEGETCIADIIDKKYQQLAPVGRLDKESEGLILLTNNGVFAKQCLDQKNPHPRVYEIKVSKPMTPQMISQCEEGIMILGQITKPCTVKMLAPLRYEITLFEGKNRQIRRMMQHVGNMVIRLKRISFGSVNIGNLQPNDAQVIESSII